MRSIVVSSDCTLLPAELCPEKDEEVVFMTTWTKVRFNPNEMTIDTQDFTYAETDVTVDSNDDKVVSRISFYKQQHVALGVAYGPGAVSYVDFTN